MRHDERAEVLFDSQFDAPYCAECDEFGHAGHCEGHESLDGPIGNTVFCDGSCVQ